MCYTSWVRMERSDDPNAGPPAWYIRQEAGTTPLYTEDTWRPTDPECEPDCPGCGVALAHYIATKEMTQCHTAEGTSSG